MNFAKIKVFDKNKNIIFEGTSLHLPINENYITKKSIELFNDPEPCIIHRTAVLFHIGNEIVNSLKNECNVHSKSIEINWSNISTEIKEKLIFKYEPDKIIINFI